MKLLRRHRRNPILEPRGDDWESLAVFNCAALKIGNEIHVLYRAIGEYVNYVSRLGHAVFDEDLNLLYRSEKPVFGPDVRLWEMSIEDPRLVEIGGRVYMTYVTTPTPAPPFAVRRRLGLPKPEQAYSRCAVAEVFDFKEFRRLGVITPYDAEERNTVLFSEKVNGGLAALHRPANWGERPGIWFSYLTGLPGMMEGHVEVMRPVEWWESVKIGAGPPPIRTEKGWLLIYHGVDERYVYRAGVALLDGEKPWKVVSRLSEPVLEPEERYEVEGDVPNVVFPTGAVVVGDYLYVFYGGADKFCCVAVGELREILEALK